MGNLNDEEDIGKIEGVGLLGKNLWKGSQKRAEPFRNPLKSSKAQ